ncbi:FAST kinase domain-containing protein 1 [Elysia marginata]|uniref:FAST kinase domain-containing protein 1 n=1 Tax=Elysia marginata TaxID=1093978 RepID=A0AAV4GUP0_9GAST|nr:FAST kinase domain-containing protein 1 [Elysia marginata]
MTRSRNYSELYLVFMKRQAVIACAGLFEVNLQRIANHLHGSPSYYFRVQPLPLNDKLTAADRGLLMLLPEPQSRHECTSSSSQSNFTNMSNLHSSGNSCYTPEAVLEFLHHQIQQNGFANHQIINVALQIKNLIFASLAFTHLSENFQFRKRQVEFTTLALQGIKRFTTDSRWEHFMSFIKSALENDRLPLKDQATLLNSLASLFVSDETEVFNILLDNCVADINLLTLKELSLVSDVCCLLERHFVMKGNILAAVHSKMKYSTAAEINLSDLCSILINLQSVIGEETLELLANLVKTRMGLGPSGVTPEILLMTYQLLTSHGGPYLQDLDIQSVKGMMCGEISLNDLPVNFMDLHSAHSSSYPWPVSNLFNKVVESCQAEMSCSDLTSLKSTSFMTLSYCLGSVPAEKLHLMIAEADIFLLFQMIGHHMSAGLTNRDTILAYYGRLLEVLPGCTEMSENNQCHKVAQVLHDFLTLLSRVGIQPDDSLREHVEAVAVFDLGKITVDMPVTALETLFQSSIDTLRSNSLLSFPDLSALTYAAPRLDTGSMLRFYNSLEEIFELSQPSVQAKNQMQKLKARLQELFLERLARAVDLPTSLIKFTTHHPQVLDTSQPGLFEDLVMHLPRFVLAGDRHTRNCLGALTVLSLTSQLCPLYQEELLEELTRFVITDCPNSPTPALQLLQALASVSYLPEDFDGFITWLWSFMSRLLTEEAVPKDFQVQMAFQMSVLGLFHEELLASIFSLPFLSKLHAELRGKPDLVVKQAYQRLVLLSRSVGIECPHLSVPYLDQSNESSSSRKVAKIDFLHQQKMQASLRRICADDRLLSCLVAPSESPYRHTIDAELILNPSNTCMPMSDANVRNNSEAAFQR